MTSIPGSQRPLLRSGRSAWVATATIYLGEVLYDKGDFNGARKSFEDALVIFRHIGARQNMARALNNIGNVLYEQGKLPDAMRYYEQTLSIYRDIDSKSGLAPSSGNIANVLDAMGDLSGAAKCKNNRSRHFAM